MTKPAAEPNWIPASWHAGVRVRRVDSSERGTIVEADGAIKVRWDSGRTSYYRRKVPANIRIEQK
jgi:hypothetical protein